MPGLPDWMRAKASLCAEANKKTIAMARKAGVKNRSRHRLLQLKEHPLPENGREFEAMVRGGLTPMESIKAGTINAAEVMQMGGRAGLS